jgi:putative tryptophan/tyrosine transport system substrate-binding protein
MRARMALAILAAVGLCSGAAAQSPTKVFRIGLVHVGIPGSCILAPGFADAFASRGYIEGKTVIFERFAAEGRLERLPDAVDRMISDKVDLLVTCGYPAALTATQRAPGIPVVVMNAGDPVETGMVESLAHPGGHVTGVSEVASDLSAKRLQLLKEAVPSVHTVALLWNQNDLAMQMRCTAAQAEAKKLGIATQLLGVRAPNDFADAFGEMDRHPPDAILLVADSLTVINHKALFDYAIAHHLPDMEELDLLAHIGGLMAYSVDENEVFDRVAALSDRILRGAKPADLPLELPTRFHFSVNLKTAHTLGLNVPEATQLRADDVIE